MRQRDDFLVDAAAVHDDHALPDEDVVVLLQCQTGDLCLGGVDDRVAEVLVVERDEFRLRDVHRFRAVHRRLVDHEGLLVAALVLEDDDALLVAVGLVLDQEVDQRRRVEERAADHALQAEIAHQVLHQHHAEVVRIGVVVIIGRDDDVVAADHRGQVADIAGVEDQPVLVGAGAIDHHRRVEALERPGRVVALVLAEDELVGILAADEVVDALAGDQAVVALLAEQDGAVPPAGDKGPLPP